MKQQRRRYPARFTFLFILLLLMSCGAEGVVESTSGSQENFRTIEGAVAHLKSRVDVPVVLPSQLPPRAHLDEDLPVTVEREADGITGTLHIVFNGEDLFLQYGVAKLQTCHANEAVEVSVASQPGLGWANDLSAELIWPATREHPVGRYGLQGTLPLGRMIQLAESMEGKVAPLTNGEGC
jgi:hypothetical protein